MQLSRDKLKELFKNGCKPTEDDFANLIDSVTNISDDINVSKETPSKEIFKGTLPADGKWHSLQLNGVNENDVCSIYNMRVICKNNDTVYALLQVKTMHVMGRKRRLEKMSSWQGGKKNRLKIRWESKGDWITLQLRTKGTHSAEINIFYELEKESIM
ncbi:MAG: hypothetical protein LBM07_02250 [Culturomica sp.]|jgi:hypothetical protein|nr:hypothetical protein [Culturomica sp.]